MLSKQLSCCHMAYVRYHWPLKLEDYACISLLGNIKALRNSDKVKYLFLRKASLKKLTRRAGHLNRSSVWVGPHGRGGTRNSESSDCHWWKRSVKSRWEAIHDLSTQSSLFLWAPLYQVQSLTESMRFHVKCFLKIVFILFKIVLHTFLWCNNRLSLSD